MLDVVTNAAKMGGFGEAEAELFTRICRVVGVAGGCCAAVPTGHAAVKKGILWSPRTGKVVLAG